MKDAQASFRALGLLTGFTGKGVDTLIIDDPYASPEAARQKAINEKVWRFWKQGAKVRLNDETNVLVMFHRYHDDDLAARLLAEGGWTYLRFPATADENEDGSDPTGRQFGELLSPIRSQKFLDEIKDDDLLTYLGMFQGIPRPADGTLIKREYLRSLTALPPIDRWVRFWDLATTSKEQNDFYAGALVGIAKDHTVIVRDITRFRAEWPDATAIIASVTEQDYLLCQSIGAEYAVGVEEVAWQRSMIQDLFQLGIVQRVGLWPLAPKGKKRERASAWVARAKWQRFAMQVGAWNDAFISECLAFRGDDSDKHDDQIDAVSGAYDLLWHLKGQDPEEKPPLDNTSVAYFEGLAEQNHEHNDYETETLDGSDDYFHA